MGTKTMGRKTMGAVAVLAGALAVAVLANGCASMPASVQAWRAGLSTATTPDGQRLAYLDAGPRDGEVIVLTHGLPTNSYLFREVIPALTSHGYRVVAPDLVGFGASSKPGEEAQYGFPRQAERLLALLDELKVDRFSLVVHDLGGLVSWELLAQQPHRVARLLVLNTTAYAKGFNPPPQMRQLGGALGGVMGAMMSGALLGRSLTGTFIGDNTAHPDRLDQGAVESFWWALHEGATVPMRAVAKNFDGIVAGFPRFQEALRRFEGPAMLLWGVRDRVLHFEEIAPQFAADLRLPPSRVRSIPDAGHFLMLDHPEVVSATLLELMALPVSTASR